jgi:uncharacterized protein
MEKDMLSLIFHGNTHELVRLPLQGGMLQYPLDRRAAIKDIVEAVGLPHTEVGRIVHAGRELTFHWIPEGGERIDIHPFTRAIPVTRATVLRPEPFAGLRFLVDINVAKLARNLRMAGIDAASVPETGILEIARLANRQGRIVLTRNRELLKVRAITFGQLLRSENPLRQMAEVVQRYGLQGSFRPFHRCLQCNSELRTVAKERIIDRLEPLTKKYYNDFKQCGSCGKIYWRGSHHERMAEMIILTISASGSG